MKTINIRLLCFLLMFSIPLILTDLHYIERKAHWSYFDRSRVKAYLNISFAINYFIPSVGPFRLTSGIVQLTKAYVYKELPPIEMMDFYRKMLVNPSFVKKLNEFECSNVKKYKHRGKTRYVKEIKQRVYFGEYKNSMYDDWMVLLCTDFIDGKPKTSYLVWGMGVCTDPKAYDFFSKQSNLVGNIIPMKWLNQLEQEGLAKGYWCLLTESNTTSKFSYSQRFLQPSQRKQLWLDSISR